jgi:predicted methyltransferase
MFGSRREVRAQALICMLAGAALLIFAPTPVIGQGGPDYAAIVAAPDRSDPDREIDKRRDPAKLLGFTGVRPGMKVLDMGAGGGYSTELMARAVGASGVVYGHNAADIGARAKERFEARMKTPAMKNVVVLTRPFDDPLPADARDLDLITFFFYYHDTTYMEVDRAEMNRKLYAALKPGGVLVIADHSARPGDGITVGKTFHRIEEGVLRREVEAAGFKLVADADFLRHPEDPRDFSVNRPTGPVDEFVLKFQKPN